MSETAVDINRPLGRFFEVLPGTARSQTAVMTIEPGPDAGPEDTHEADQIIYIVEGEATVRVEDNEHHAKAGVCVLAPRARATT